MTKQIAFDNTRLTSSRNCMRSYYFRHVRHWRREGNKAPLAFGLGIHAGMDMIWGAAQNKDGDWKHAAQLALVAFKEVWEAEGMAGIKGIDTDPKRNPGVAGAIFLSYAEKYWKWLNEIEILYIEQPFIVPINEDYIYIGRWDKVYKDKRGVHIGEHKTTSLYRKIGGVAKEWTNSFAPDSQIDGYIFSGLGIFGDVMKSCTVDGILVHKTHRFFVRLPIARSFSNLDAWFWETKYQIDEIQANLEMLEMLKESNQEGDFMTAFPKDTWHCQHKYGQCTYYDLCRFGSPNPISMDCPDGFIEERWDPMEHNTADGMEPLTVGRGF